jgi:predicted amidohydrolase
MALDTKPAIRDDGDGMPEPILVEIDIDEFEEDRHDREWRNFLRRAKEYSARLRREGRLE